MRSIFFVLTVFISISGIAQKNQPRNASPEEKTRKFFQLWTKELTLSSDQQAKAQPAILNMFTKIGTLRSDTTMDRKVKAKAIQTARKEGNDAFKALLTADQVVLYDKKIQELKEKQRSKQGGKQPKSTGKNKGVKQAAEEELENDELF